MIFTGSIYSQSLDIDTWLHIVYPDRSCQSVPPKVIYMLHGSSGNSSNWIENTMLPLYAQEYNVVFILPEVGNTWYRDIPYRGNYFTYVVQELPDMISNIFKFPTDRENVAIMGNSMGAYGALKCALLHPEKFSLCASFSTACVTVREYLDELREQKEDIQNPNMLSVFGSELKCNDDDELLKLAKKANKSDLSPKIYMSIGNQDFLYEPNIDFSKKMKQLNLDYTFEIWDGEHNWHFWNESLKHVLDKYYA